MKKKSNNSTQPTTEPRLKHAILRLYNSFLCTFDGYKWVCEDEFYTRYLNSMANPLDPLPGLYAGLVQSTYHPLGVQFAIVQDTATWLNAEIVQPLEWVFSDTSGATNKPLPNDNPDRRVY